jgi:IS5 family transposase
MSCPDFVRARLDAMLDLRHQFAVLLTGVPWAQIEAALAAAVARMLVQR